MKKIVSIVLAVSMLAVCVTGCKTTTRKQLKPVVLNEVAHSIFYAPSMPPLNWGILRMKARPDAGQRRRRDKVMTALISGDAISFMGSEASIYVYQQGSDDYAVNFAQLTQRAGNFLVGREAQDNFTWADLKGKKVLGGRAGGMPEMVFEYILKKNGSIPPQI